MKSIIATAFFIVTVPTIAVAVDGLKTLDYVRPVGSQYRAEFQISIQTSVDGHEVSSVTHRADTTLTIASRFDSVNRLRTAQVTLKKNDQAQSATIRTDDGKATVTRDAGEMSLFDCPPKVIVTSAPDWTDACLLMQYYDAKRSGPQEFPGLWVHPTRQPLRLTFKVIPSGMDTVTIDGDQQQLERFVIVLRNGSRYIAWRNKHNHLVCLIPNQQKHPALILRGWEKALSKLKP